MALVVKKGLKGTIANWTGLAGGDAGDALEINGKKSVQVLGTFGTSTVNIEGSNDGVNWVTLHDQAVPANTLAFTAAGLNGVLEATRFIRPNVTAGTGTGLQIILLAEN